MNKTQLIALVSERTEMSKAGCERVIDEFLRTIAEAVKEGDAVSLSGFGTFAQKERAARSGRNPQTGEKINIAAKKLFTFKPAKKTSEQMN